MSSIVLDKLTKQYRRRRHSRRELHGSGRRLHGAAVSGCGKSTTLRMIAGLDTPTSGTIHIGDRDVTQLPPARRISMVFQSYALFPHLSVRENILFGLKVRKEPARDYERRLQRVAGLLGLGHLLDRKPSQLSGGQQQRVALGRRDFRSAGLPDGRTAVQPGRPAAPRHAPRDPRAAAGPGHHHGVRDARPDRGHEHGRPGGAAARAARSSSTTRLTACTRARQANSRAPHRHAAHEPDRPGRAARRDHDRRRARPGRRPAGAVKLGVRPEHIRIDGEGREATVESVEFFGADSIVVCRMGDTSGVAVRGRAHACPRRRDAAPVLARRTTAFLRRRFGGHQHRALKRPPQERKHDMRRIVLKTLAASLAAACLSPRRRPSRSRWKWSSTTRWPWAARSPRSSTTW